jgi:hypothetical protein
LHNQRHREAERLGRLKIDDKFELGRLLDREIGRFSPLENAIHVNRRLPELIGEIHSIRDETAAFREDTDRVDSRNLMASRLPDYEVAVNMGKCIQENDQAAVWLAAQTG